MNGGCQSSGRIHKFVVFGLVVKREDANEEREGKMLIKGEDANKQTVNIPLKGGCQTVCNYQQREDANS